MKHKATILILLVISSTILYSSFSNIESKNAWFFYTNQSEERSLPFFRIYLNDSIFVEQYYSWDGFPIISEHTLDTFKLVNGSMFYKMGGYFYPHFSVKAFNNGDTIREIYTDFRDVHYIPFERDTINGKLVYGFIELIPKWKKARMKKDDYFVKYFHPEKGIVGTYEGEHGVFELQEAVCPF